MQFPEWCYGNYRWNISAEELKFVRGWENGSEKIEGIDFGESYEWDVWDVWSNPLTPGILYAYSGSGCSCNNAYDDFNPTTDFDILTSYSEFESWFEPKDLKTYRLGHHTAHTQDISIYKETVYKWFRDNTR